MAANGTSVVPCCSMGTLQKSVTKARKQRRGVNPCLFYEVPFLAALQMQVESGASHRSWRVVVDGIKDNPRFSFERILIQPGGRWDTLNLNPWFIRGELFKVDTPEQAKKFFERFGPWQYKNSLGPTDPLPITFRALTHQRNYFMDLLDHSIEDWDKLTKKAYPGRTIEDGLRGFFEANEPRGPLPFELWFDGQVSAQAIVRSVYEAVRASVLLDKAKARRFVRCVCGCGRPISATANGGRKYFDKKCGNKARQAKWRSDHAH